MAGELFLALYLGYFVYADAYFSLPLFVFLFMNLMLSLKAEGESFARVAKKLKDVGSFSYLFHVQFFVYLHWILDACNANVFRSHAALLLIPYFACVLLCFGLQTLCAYLAKRPRLRFLAYSY